MPVNFINFLLTDFLDFFLISGVDIFLDPSLPEQCFSINIVDDVTFEGNETFTITVEIPPELNDGLIVEVDPAVTTITIVDNDERKTCKYHLLFLVQLIVIVRHCLI